jgi:competence protein ComEC
VKEKILPLLVIFLIFFVFLGSQIFQLFSSDKTYFIFCDVGEGDGAVLIHKSTVILIDAGRDYKMEKCLERHLPFWIHEITGVILTHPDADHIGGLKTVMKRYSVKQLFSNFSANKIGSYKDLLDALANSGVSFRSFIAGDKIQVKVPNSKFKVPKIEDPKFQDPKIPRNILIESLWPNETHKESEKTNLYSNIDVVTIGSSRFLMLADSEIETQLSVLGFQLSEFSQSVDSFQSKKTENGKTGQPDAENRKLRTDNRFLAVKVSHHGSTKNYSETLMRTLAPKYAIISVGTNTYGHPGKKAIEQLESLNSIVPAKAGIQILRTDKHGDVVFECSSFCELK